MKKNIKTDFVLWARQYSKRLISALLIAWGTGAVIGAVYEFIRLIAAPEIASMDSFYIYLAVPLTCGLPSYLIPNLILNKEKVKQNYIPDYDNTFLAGGEYDGEDGIGNTDNQRITEEINVTGFHDYPEDDSAQSGSDHLPNI